MKPPLKFYFSIFFLVFIFNSGCTNNSIEINFNENLRMAIKHESQYRYTEAESYYLKALRDLPRGSRYNEKRAYALSCLAKLENKAIKPDKSLETATKAIGLYQNLIDSRRSGLSMRDNAFQLVELLTLKAKLQLKRKELNKALDTINSADQVGKKMLAPDHLRYKIMIVKARILTSRGDYKEANELKNTARVISPSRDFDD